ncbi:MAG: rod shape-determining protein MreC [Bacteroidetes bacterium]|nr:rod shape-determining protein MreC [Bacteroidota bacterium]MBS1638967.1 rod shape-determining protein MreC [Bacteroidota bacterium]
MKNIFLFIRRFFIFICFIIMQIICIVMLTKSSKTHEAFFTNATTEIVGKVDKQYAGIHSYFHLKEINQQLSEENAKLNNELKENFVEPDSLKKIVIDTTTTDSLNRHRKFIYFPAMVVGNTVTLQNNYLILERGSKQGVRKGMSVVSPQGIAGVVLDVSENYCRVMSLLHRNSKVSAMLKHNNNFGSIEWDGKDPSFLTLKNISKAAKVVKGDSVVTSTYSANFPPNIMIGTVEAITSDPSSNFYTLKIKTATNFFTIQYVNIIANTRFTEQTQLETAKPKINE